MVSLCRISCAHIFLIISYILLYYIGIGLAVGLGVVAIITAAVPVILAPGEDAFNEMRDKDDFDGKRGR